MKIFLLITFCLLANSRLNALDFYEQLHLETFADENWDENDSIFDEIIPLVIHVETTALENIEPLFVQEEKKDEPEDTPPLAIIEQVQEAVGARVSYKNRTVKENESHTTVDQELVITLTTKFFEQKDDQTLQLSTGIDDRTLTLTYKKDVPLALATSEVPLDEIAYAVAPKVGPSLNLEEEVVIQDSSIATFPKEISTADYLASKTTNLPIEDDSNHIDPKDVPEQIENPSEPQIYHLENFCGTQNYCRFPDRFLFGYSFGEGIDTDKNYTQYGLLLYPEWKVDPLVPILSLNAYRLSNNKWAGSFGGAVRWPDAERDYVYGLNVFYDFIKQHFGTFHQIGVGGELLSRCWEARFNAYFPVGKDFRLRTASFFDEYIGSYFVHIKTLEQAQRGFDAEVGYNYYLQNNLRLYAGAGPAWFKQTYWHQSRWAFKLRGLIEWNDYVSFEARTFKQCSQKWDCQGLAWISIPLEFFCQSSCDPCGVIDLFERLIYRNAVIKTSHNCCWETNF